jgi:D-amino-acid dehydrogenase
MQEQTPVTVIGAGIVGICCALSLRERGVPVRLIDRGDPGQETSFGNAGVISPWSFIPQSLPGVWKNIPKLLLDPEGPLSVRPSFWPSLIPWGLRFIGQANEKRVRDNADNMETLCGPSIDLYRHHLKDTGYEDLITDSYYVHAFRKAEKADIKAIDYQIRIEKGGQIELVGEDALSRLEPALSKAFKAAILIKGQARTSSPGKIGEVLAQKAIAAGAVFEKAELTKITPAEDGTWILHAKDREFSASKVILATGIWSAKFLEPLGVKIPMVAERGYHVQFSSPQVELSNSVLDVDNQGVASFMIDGLRLAGSAEFAQIDAPADERKKVLLTKQAVAMCPDLDTRETSFWMGRRPSLPDSLPVIGQIEGHNGLYGAFGHSHYGLMMAPKTGELIADIITEKRNNFDLKSFSNNRFS